MTTISAIQSASCCVDGSYVGQSGYASARWTRPRPLSRPFHHGRAEPCGAMVSTRRASVADTTALAAARHAALSGCPHDRSMPPAPLPVTAVCRTVASDACGRDADAHLSVASSMGSRRGARWLPLERPRQPVSDARTPLSVIVVRLGRPGRDDLHGSCAFRPASTRRQRPLLLRRPRHDAPATEQHEAVEGEVRRVWRSLDLRPAVAGAADPDDSRGHVPVVRYDERATAEDGPRRDRRTARRGRWAAKVDGATAEPQLDGSAAQIRRAAREVELVVDGDDVELVARLVGHVRARPPCERGDHAREQQPEPCDDQRRDGRPDKSAHNRPPVLSECRDQHPERVPRRPVPIRTMRSTSRRNPRTAAARRGADTSAMTQPLTPREDEHVADATDAGASTDVTGAAGDGGRFAGLGLDDGLLRTLAELGYEEPTAIQQAAIPPLLEGRDVLAEAPTGTGKTAAFALPMLQRFGPSGVQGGSPRGLVLAPTRELAIQVAEAIHRYGQSLGTRVVPVYGGHAIGKRLRGLRPGGAAVGASPGG